jgi:hypothetical protein
MNLAAYFRDFQKFIHSDPRSENDLNDILTDTDLSEENQLEELIVLLERLESHQGLEIPKVDFDVKELAKFIRNYYLTNI